MRTIAAAFAFVIASLAVPHAQTTPSAEDLARRIQAHYDSVKDFQAEFTQSFHGGFTRPLPPEKGRLLIKKPGRMYWKYEGASKREWWTDGVRSYVYDGSMKQGTIAPIPTGSDAGATVLLLMGQGNLPRDFNASLTGDQPPDQWRLTLVPKKADPNVKSMVVIVDRATLKLIGLETLDGQGATNVWRFQNLKENVGLADKEFNKQFPPGTRTEIIRG